MNAVFPRRTFIFIAAGCLFGCIGGFGLRSVLTEIPQTSVAKLSASQKTVDPVSTERAAMSDFSPITAVNAEEETEIDYEQMFARLEAEGLRLVPKKVLFHLMRNPIRPNQPILPMIEEALRLSPLEVERTDEVLKTVEKELATLEMERVERISHGDNHVTFRIHPFPADGAKLHNRLRSELTEILGEMKGDLFAELINEYGTYFDGFGAAPLEVSFHVWDVGPTFS